MESDGLHVGYLRGPGHMREVVGTCCAKPHERGGSRVYPVHVWPYNQDCACCRKPVVIGRPGLPVLFGGRAEIGLDRTMPASLP